jgi:hypothetical protein
MSIEIGKKPKITHIKQVTVTSIIAINRAYSFLITIEDNSNKKEDYVIHSGIT